MKKKLLLVILITLMLCGCSKQAAKLKNGEEAIVTFNKEKLSISAEDLYSELKDRYGAEELYTIIDTKILETKYKNDLEDVKKEADSTIDTIKENFKDDNGNYDESQLLAALKQYYNYDSIAEFKDAVVLDSLRAKASEDYVKGKITDKEIKKYYEDDIVGDRKVSHIEIIPDTKDDMSDEDIKKAEEAALKEAKEVIAKLKKGEKFADLAKEYSDDEDTSKKGGDLGYINKGDYGDDLFDSEVWSLEVGKYSATPVKTASGYEIVYITKEKEKAALKDVKKDIINSLTTEKLQADPALQFEALSALRESYGMKFEDKELKSSFQKHISELKTNATQTTTNN